VFNSHANKKCRNETSVLPQILCQLRFYFSKLQILEKEIKISNEV